MPSNRFAVNPYPELHVSEEERTQLIELVDGFVQDYFQKYEDFVVVDKQKVDEQRWKHVKTKDSQHVYAERSGKEKRDAGVVSWNPENAKDGATPKKDVPVVLSVGALVGDLDDLMFGVVNPTLDVMRIKASYLIRRKISFCAKCVNEATKRDAKEAAKDQATGYRAYKAFSTSSQSDTASQSSLFD
ncbi:hypothetical protein PRNP1_014467 [Phytophthora ramorum]